MTGSNCLAGTRKIGVKSSTYGELTNDKAVQYRTELAGVHACVDLYEGLQAAAKKVRRFLDEK